MRLLKQYKILFLIIILTSLAIAPAFALGEGNRNLLLIILMGFSPIVVLFDGKLFYKQDILLLLYVGTIILFPWWFNPEYLRWSTILYSCMFALTFVAYCRIIPKSSFTAFRYQNILKYLIYAYFFVLLIQQFCVLTGLPIFNVSNYIPHDKWKLNSLAPEPSHSARIVALLMYCYIFIKEQIKGRKYNFIRDFGDDKWIWVAFLWTMITMGSGTAFLFIPIILLKFIRLRNLIPLFILVGVGVYLTTMMGTSALDRTIKTAKATLTLDPDKIIEADHSASFRIVPAIVLANTVSLESTNDWFGYGIDYTSEILSDAIPAMKEGTTGGGLLQLWIEYGFITFVLFIVFSFLSTFNKKDYISIIFWFLLVFMFTVNNQIVWLCIILLYTNKYFSENNRINVSHSKPNNL